ncbi:hypothetical protein [Oceanobacillus halotolerans]|uniref:hypothetical protein n=1 Tax=Oceanobacillus halotolerans TaxID=2663380 RepID=UPI0013DA8A6C|nr:hypothetical protein [Oceanobacillus halotolerans]
MFWTILIGLIIILLLIYVTKTNKEDPSKDADLTESEVDFLEKDYLSQGTRDDDEDRKKL